MTTLPDWAAAVAAALDLPAAPEVRVVLEIARDVAHAVERPAAPLTTWLIGAAVAGGLDRDEALARVRALAAGWPAPPVG